MPGQVRVSGLRQSGQPCASLTGSSQEVACYRLRRGKTLRMKGCINGPGIQSTSRQGMLRMLVRVGIWNTEYLRTHFAFAQCCYSLFRIPATCRQGWNEISPSAPSMSTTFIVRSIELEWSKKHVKENSSSPMAKYSCFPYIIQPVDKLLWQWNKFKIPSRVQSTRLMLSKLKPTIQPHRQDTKILFESRKSWKSLRKGGPEKKRWSSWPSITATK